MKGPELGRWSAAGSEELPPELARLLRAAQDQRGTPQEVAELGHRLAALLGPASGLPGALAEPPEASGASRAASERVEPASPGEPAAAGGARDARGPQGARAATRELVSRSWRPSWGLAGGGAIAAALAIGVLGPRLLPEPGSAGPDRAPAQSGPSEAPEAPAPQTGSRGSRPAVEPVPAVEPQRVEPQRVERERAAERPAMSPPRAAEAPPAPGKRRVAPPTPRARPLDEAGLLRRAQAALGERPAQALALAGEHARRFPEGALAQEREVIAIAALERLGRAREAAARAEAFERRWRGSVHQPRLERGPGAAAGGGGAGR